MLVEKESVKATWRVGDERAGEEGGGAMVDGACTEIAANSEQVSFAPGRRLRTLGVVTLSCGNLNVVLSSAAYFQPLQGLDLPTLQWLETEAREQS